MHLTLTAPPPLPCPVVIARLETAPAVWQDGHLHGHIWRRAGSALPKGARVVAMIDPTGDVVALEPWPEREAVLAWAADQFHAAARRAARDVARLADLLDHAATIPPGFLDVAQMDPVLLRHALDQHRDQYPVLRVAWQLVTSAATPEEAAAQTAELPSRWARMLVSVCSSALLDRDSDLAFAAHLAELNA